MEIILLEKIHKLGGLGDNVRVRPGYARNFLIPTGKAIRATKQNIEHFESRRAELEKHAKEIVSNAEKRAKNLAELSVVKITALTGDEGKLYGSIGTREIADAITAAGVELQKSEVLLPHGALRYVGEYDIHCQLEGDVEAAIKIVIEAEA